MFLIQALDVFLRENRSLQHFIALIRKLGTWLHVNCTAYNIIIAHTLSIILRTYAVLFYVHTWIELNIIQTDSAHGKLRFISLTISAVEYNGRLCTPHAPSKVV